MNKLGAALQDLSTSFQSYYHKTLQGGMSVVLKMSDFRNNPDFFQKTCQVVFAGMQLSIISDPTRSPLLSRISNALKTANLHDFYAMVQRPRQWFLPISAGSINETKLLEGLLNYAEATEQYDQDLPSVLQNCIEDQLIQMASSNDAYHNMDEFLSVLQKRLDAQSYPNFLSDLEKDNPIYLANEWVRQATLADRIANLNWTVVDAGCIALYFQEWGLLDTAKWAERISQNSKFQWVKTQSLETWVVGVVCTGFAWKLFESTRRLFDEKLTKEAKSQMRWNAITSLGELVLFGASYTNLVGLTTFNNVYLQSFAVAAKSLGLFSIAMKPSHEYFKEND